MARRVPRAMQHLELELAHRDPVALMQPAVGRERLGGWEAEHLRLGGHLLDPEQIALMRPLDGDARAPRELRGGARVVEMRVGDEDLLEREPVALENRQHPRQLTARVDDGRAARGLAPQHRAVLLERRDRDDFETHARMILRGAHTVIARPR